MVRQPLALFLTVLTFLAACAGPEQSGVHTEDPADLAAASPDLRDGSRDLAGADLASAPDAGCTLGTADHCGACNTKCPPGADDIGTTRTCSSATVAGTCDITCRGEFYDVDGEPPMKPTGCELIDEPVQDTAQTAVALVLPDIADDPKLMSNPRNVDGKLYCDNRLHDAVPVHRPNGRDDWYAVTANGAGNANVGMKACLGIVSHPADNLFEVCISAANVAVFDPNSCLTVAGAKSPVCVTPPGQPDAGGPYYVRVRKLQGTPTINSYALFLQH